MIFLSEPSQLNRFLSYPGCFWNLRTFVPVFSLHCKMEKQTKITVFRTIFFFFFYKPVRLTNSTFHSCTTNNKNYKTEYAISSSISKQSWLEKLYISPPIQQLLPQPLHAVSSAWWAPLSPESANQHQKQKAGNSNINFLPRLSKQTFFFLLVLYSSNSLICSSHTFFQRKKKAFPNAHKQHTGNKHCSMHDTKGPVLPLCYQNAPQEQVALNKSIP